MTAIGEIFVQLHLVIFPATFSPFCQSGKDISQQVKFNSAINNTQAMPTYIHYSL